jgi:hypothetical protein
LVRGYGQAERDHSDGGSVASGSSGSADRRRERLGLLEDGAGGSG